jgi:hypothetical protein
MRVFDAGREAEDFDMITADLSRKVGEVGERGDDADFVSRVNLRRAKQRDEGDEQRFQFHKTISPFKI